MSDDELRDQIASLRSEVRRLSDSFIGLRDEEVRKVFSRQVRPVLKERIDRALDRPASPAHKELRAALLTWVDDVFEAFERGGRDDGLRYLERRSARSVCHDADEELVDALEEQVCGYLDTYGRVASGPDGARLPVRTVGEISPEKVEKALGPLSSRVRVGILLHLAREDDGLASLSRALGLQKGHLQFHLRSLLDGRYIAHDRKSRLYSLTPRGRRALDTLGRMMEDLDAENG